MITFRPEAVAGNDGTFADGGRFRIEIPSVEGPATLNVVLEEADRMSLPIHRISQGSGVAMLRDAEITEMVNSCREARIELCLFLGPRGTWDIGAGTRTPAAGSGPRVRGLSQVQYSIDDAVRATELGVPCLLLADEGVLWELHKLRSSGELPSWLKLKFSALAGPANPASFALIEQLGADSINVPGDLPLGELVAMRQASAVPIDLYLESPDALGGFVRHHEAPAFIDQVGRIYLKFGLRNAPEMYPAGQQTSVVTMTSARERVRRASLVVERLEQSNYMRFISPVGSPAPSDLRRLTPLAS